MEFYSLYNLDLHRVPSIYIIPNKEKLEKHKKEESVFFLFHYIFFTVSNGAFELYHYHICKIELIVVISKIWEKFVRKIFFRGFYKLLRSTFRNKSPSQIQLSVRQWSILWKTTKIDYDCINHWRCAQHDWRKSAGDLPPVTRVFGQIADCLIFDVAWEFICKQRNIPYGLHIICSNLKKSSYYVV